MRSIVDEWLKVDRADCSSLINGLLDANSTLPFVLLETVRGEASAATLSGTTRWMPSRTSIPTSARLKRS